MPIPPPVAQEKNDPVISGKESRSISDISSIIDDVIHRIERINQIDKINKELEYLYKENNLPEIIPQRFEEREKMLLKELEGFLDNPL